MLSKPEHIECESHHIGNYSMAIKKKKYKFELYEGKQCCLSWGQSCGVWRVLSKHSFLSLPPCSNDLGLQSFLILLCVALPDPICVLGACPLDSSRVYPPGSLLSIFPSNVSIYRCQILLLKLHLIIHPLLLDPLIILVAHFRQ